MAKVIAIGQPANDSERKAIGFLRDHLPDGYIIFHNFEIRQGAELFEIDMAILAPHAIYLVDVKGVHGLVDVHGAKWYPEGRQPYYSPLAKLRQHARTMTTLIRESNPGIHQVNKAFVKAVVLLTEDDAFLQDPEGKDKPDVTNLKNCIKYFSDKSIIGDRWLSDIRPYHAMISKAIHGKARPKSSAQCFRDWQVEEKLGGDDHYTEYRAKHSLLGARGGMARLRVYQADPYQEENARQEELKRISNAYRSVAHMPSHSNILAVKDLFLTDENDKIILVTEDVPGQVLRQYFLKTNLGLTFDQKLQIMRDTLMGLDHAHRHEVIHRNLTPDAIIVTKGGTARITAFDFARVGKNRTSTIADQIVDDLDTAYQAPECYRDPKQASIASDIYSVGLIFYELLTGDSAFENTDQMLEADGKFPVKPSEIKTDLPKGIDNWLQKFCEFDPEDRYISAAVAKKELDTIILPEIKEKADSDDGQETVLKMPDDFADLPRDYVLADRFSIQEKLGSGGFGVAYKVFDSFGDVVRVLKIVTKDRKSVYERLRREYKTLTQLPDHKHVVKVVWADRFNDSKQTPYIVFEYVAGLDVSDLIDAEALSIDDAVNILQQTADGLKHLHSNGIYHQDVKPSNLLWTDKGVRIIDFNVATSDDDLIGGGGTRRYIPPDYNYDIEASTADRIDRDIYALGITFYECLTGSYPFEDSTPPLQHKPKDIKQFKNCDSLVSPLVSLVNKMISPQRKGRFASAQELINELSRLKPPYKTLIDVNVKSDSAPKSLEKLGLAPKKANCNPFVSHLLTLYSQSQFSNAGTRGLDEVGKATYIPTYLDEKLQPALLKGEFRLVIITGNAGDGKTAFIQKFEEFAESKGVQIKRGLNGAVFELKGHTFLSNYDGSQDEGDQRNDLVLQNFFEPFKGRNLTEWPDNQTRIIAINEGRLVDFFMEHEIQYPLVANYIQKGLDGQPPENGIAVINLNLRSVVAETGKEEGAIIDHLIKCITRREYWQICKRCDLCNKCYVYHNICTFQDETAGPKVAERLKKLFTITHLRGRLHITMRDLRSALSYMLVGTKDCDGIHELYTRTGEEAQNLIFDGFYFNSWMGGESGSADRLISLLSEIDIAQVSNPRLDRELGFLSPDFKDMSRFSFSGRSTYDNDLANALFKSLPRDYSSRNRQRLLERHRRYVTHLRRRHYFECRDSSWRDMLPYSSMEDFEKIILDGKHNAENVEKLILAINRGEGLSDPTRLGNQLALKVRKVEKGTIRSYRLFNGEKFRIHTDHNLESHPFLECMPQNIVLEYSDNHHFAKLTINLDIYEMLMRLNNGYRPSVEEEEGFYLSLSVFKNVLSAAPYKEVLLTENGHVFYQINRSESGVLSINKVKRSAD